MLSDIAVRISVPVEKLMPNPAFFARSWIVAAPCVLLLAFAAPHASAAEVFFVDLEPLGSGVSESVARRISEGTKEQLATARVEFTSEVRQSNASLSGNAAVEAANG